MIIENKDYLTFLETFIPSREMREYLLGIELDDYTEAEIVMYALVPLETKAAWLEGEDRQAVEDALRELHKVRPGEFFCLIDEWYDPEIFNEVVPGYLQKKVDYLRAQARTRARGS